MITKSESIAAKIAGHIEAMRREFNSLPNNATVPDLCRRFIPFLTAIFDESTLAMYYHPTGTTLWSPMDDVSVPAQSEHLDLPHPTDPAFLEIGNGGRSLDLLHHLADDSSIYIRVAREAAGSVFADVDLVSLRLLVHLFEASSRTLITRRTEKGLIFSLNQRVLQLTSLIDTGIEMSRLDANGSPHLLALERAASLTNAARGLLTIDSPEGRREQFWFPSTPESSHGARSEVRIGSLFTFHGQTYTFQLFEKESRGGIHPFDDTDQMLLDALVRQLHASLENRFLLAQSLEKQKIEQDIAVAASIQQRILPTTLPTIAGYELAGINIPSKSVGGDYYDCIPLRDGRYALVIADVSGKGVPAALLVSSLHAYLSAYLESPISLVDLSYRLNKVIWSAATEDKFITAFLAILTPESGELTFVNAGHTPVYLLHEDGSVQELTSGGIPFGMLEIELPYVQESVLVRPGDRLLLYTDGIPEAMNLNGDLYDSVKPFKQFVLEHVTPTATQFIQEMVGELRGFIGSAPQSDDITALYMIREG